MNRGKHQAIGITLEKTLLWNQSTASANEVEIGRNQPAMEVLKDYITKNPPTAKEQ